MAGFWEWVTHYQSIGHDVVSAMDMARDHKDVTVYYGPDGAVMVHTHYIFTDEHVMDFSADGESLRLSLGPELAFRYINLAVSRGYLARGL